MYFMLYDIQLSIKVAEMFSTDCILKIINLESIIIINFTGTLIFLPSNVVVFNRI